MGNDVKTGIRSLIQKTINRVREESISTTLYTAFIFICCKLSFPILAQRPSLYRYIIHMRGLLLGQEVTDADPLKLVSVDPCEIVYLSGKGWPLKRGRVVDGQWDLTERRFTDEKESAQEIQSRFDRGTIGDSSDNIDRLYRAIEHDGYRSQRELLETVPEKVRKENNEFTIVQFNEVTVDIGRDGKILWRTQGKHRLAIAQCLELEHIPVLVCKRHLKWQNIRDKVRTSDSIDDLNDEIQSLLEHPDLQDIRPDG